MAKGLWLNKDKFVSFAELNSDLSGDIATRRRRFEFVNMELLPNPDPVLKRMGKDISVYRNLLSDAHLSAAVESRKAGTLSLNWEINRGGDKDRAAKIIDDIFHQLDINRIIDEMLNAAMFGYQPLEIQWEVRDGWVVPADVVGKPPEWFCFDPENRLRFKSAVNFFPGELLPDRKFLVAAHRAEYANPYGIGQLSCCFWPVTFKRGGWKFWAVFSEKYGMPWMVGKHPAGATKEDKKTLLDAMEDAVQDALLILPENCSMEIKESAAKTGSADIYERLIIRADGESSKAIVGQTLTTEVGVNGSYAAAQTHFKVRGDIVTGDAKMVCGVFQQLIDWIYEMNFPQAQRARLDLFAEEDVDKEQAERDEILSRAGLRYSKNYFKRTYNLSDDDITDIVSPGAQSQGPAFAEAPAPDIADQIADNLDPAELQAEAEGLLKPVFDLVADSASHDDLLEKLAALYPEMATAALEEKLTHVIFIADLLAMSKQEPVK